MVEGKSWWEAEVLEAEVGWRKKLRRIKYLSKNSRSRKRRRLRTRWEIRNVDEAKSLTAK